ncbi:MAG: hypothetical protein H0X22_08485, partial [Acidimicrobiia bacterium]|nr:hypothetical protein [Acidimicrobiia bacterium]
MLADTPAFGSSNEGCALNGQFTAFENSDQASFCHNGTACQSSGDSNNPGPYCYPGGTECPPGGGGGPARYRTYLAYRWLDMDGDGLVDLVAAAHGDIDHYDIARGNRVGYDLPQEPFGPWPACPGTLLDRCKETSAACAAPSRGCDAFLGTCNTNWGTPLAVPESGPTMNNCITQAPSLSCSRLLRRAATSPAQETPETPDTPYTRTPYERCEGLFPWFIYKNTGNGVFASTPIIKYQPVPLESDTGDSNMSGPTVTSADHTISDFDGDGILDAVVRPQPQNNEDPDNWWWWYVWLGDGSGGFAGKRFVFSTRDRNDNHVSKTSSNQPGPAGEVLSSHGLIDANGDGLPDHWVRDVAADNVNIAFNEGTRFGMYPMPNAGPVGELYTTSGAVIANDIDTSITAPSPWSPGTTILEGESSARNRTVDVDGDGRIDIVRTGAQGPYVRFNLGGQFAAGSGVPYPGNAGGLERLTRARNEVPLVWEVRSDLIDLDGDGIAESVAYEDSGFHRFERAPATTPPRLLQSINNGRGARVTVGYGQMHDSTVVEQHPEQTWFDGRPKTTPRTQWVVRSVVDVDDFSSTTATTGYFYRNPRHGADDEGRFAFRGFEEVIATSPTSMKTVQRYSYTPDWSGRLAQTLVLPAPSEGSTDVRSISKSTWIARTLFGGVVTAFYPTIAESLTCANGQTEASCVANPAGYTRTESTLVDFPISGQKLLTLETGTLLKKQVGTADGDRQTIRTFDMLLDGTTYRVRPRTLTKEHRVGGAMTMFAKSDQTWDPTFAANLTNEVWFDTNDANRAIAKTVYDMTTGNVVERWKPVQNAASTTRTVLTYDSRELFVATEVDEVGHGRDYLWNYGTGTKLRTDGPNVRDCTTNCPPLTPTSVLKEQQSVKIDGLGRTIERWETQSVEGGAFTLFQMELTSYFDAVVAPTTPSSMTHQTRQSTNAAVLLTQVKTELDGHGRPLRRIESVNGTAPTDHVTLFQYRNDGTLQTATVPDPTQNNASLVSYAYGFDSLGRATSIRRPDAAAAIDQSGADISYDGLSKTVTEVVGVAGGTPSVTKTVTDPFGRLIEVHEQTLTSPITFAISHYVFGPDDNMATVIDPENVTTQLQHDFAGHRTQITRHGRIWKYGYDKNGNLISQQAPGSPSPPVTDPDYTTTIAYDDIDRMKSKLVGQRGLSAADQVLFGGRTEKLQWDYGGNMTGRLYAWLTYAPNTTVPTITRSTANTDQGGERSRKHNFYNVAGLAGERSVSRKFSFDNKLTEIRYGDALPGSSEYTLGKFHYDARGNPLQLGFLNINSGQPNTTIGVQTRNVAGLVTKRKSTTTGAMTFVESNWTYDKLGRVTSQVVQKAPGPVEV